MNSCCCLCEDTSASFCCLHVASRESKQKETRQSFTHAKVMIHCWSGSAWSGAKVLRVKPKSGYKLCISMWMNRETNTEDCAALSDHMSQSVAVPSNECQRVNKCEAGKEQTCSDCDWVNKLYLMKILEGISPNLTKAKVNLLLLVKLFNWLNQFDHGLSTDVCLSAQTGYIMIHWKRQYFFLCCVTDLICQKIIIILNFYCEQ